MGDERRAGLEDADRDDRQLSVREQHDGETGIGIWLGEDVAGTALALGRQSDGVAGAERCGWS